MIRQERPRERSRQIVLYFFCACTYSRDYLMNVLSSRVQTLSYNLACLRLQPWSSITC
jgi:hypothetical protein